MAALNQEMFLQVQVGIPGLYRTCFSVYPCKTPYATTTGMDFIAHPNPGRARQLLEESGYSGTPIVLLQPTDVDVARQASARRGAAPAAGGLHRGHAADELEVAGVAASAEDRLAHLHHEFTGRVTWPIPSTTTRSTPAATRRGLAGRVTLNWSGCETPLPAPPMSRSGRRMAEQVQVRAMEIGTHVPLGEYVNPVAARKNVKGLLPGPQTMVLWNVEKQ